MDKESFLKKFVVISILIIVTRDVLAQDKPKGPDLFILPLNYIVYKTRVPVNIDGKDMEAIWDLASWSSYFVDIEGNDKPSPEFKTRFKMLWDDQFLYVLAELEEPHVWATLGEHDQIIYRDNDFEIFMDPDGDAHQYFEIEVNAFGTILDLFMSKPYRNGGQALISWNAINLKTGVNIDGTINDPLDTDKKWCVEMAIPFGAVSIGNSTQVPVDSTIWRINFSRVQWDTEVHNNTYKKKINPETGALLAENNWVWSPQGVINMHMPERWGYLQFSSQMAGNGKITFNLPRSEPKKAHLWQIYYLQADYFWKNGRYATDLKTLGFDKTFKHDSHFCNVLLEATSYQFTAILRCESLKGGWCIDEGGRIRKFDLHKRK